MFFNPLFLQVINNPESVNSSKTQKLNGSSYLFSDIIKVAFEKSEMEGTATSSENGNSILNMDAAGQFDPNAFLQEITGGTSGSEAALYQLLGEVVPGNFKLGDLQGNNGIVGLPLVSNSDSKSIVLNENEVSSMISKFLEGNFQGKVNVLSGKTDQKKINVKSFDVTDNSSLSSDELFSLLKDGNAVSLESNDAQNTKGLLITLFKIASPDNADSVNEAGMKSELSETEKKDNTGIPESAADYSTNVPDNFYKVEITVIDKTGYQELSSLELLKTQGAGTIVPDETAKQDINSVPEFNNSAARIFKIENGFTGPADMSGVSSFNETENFNTLPGTAAGTPVEVNTKPVNTNGQSGIVNNTEKQPVTVTVNAEGQSGIKSENAEQIPSAKNIQAVPINNSAAVKTDENISGTGNIPASSTETKISGRKAAETDKSKTDTGMSSEINQTDSGKKEVPAGRLSRTENPAISQEPTVKSGLDKKQTVSTETTELPDEKNQVKSAAGTNSAAAGSLTAQDDQNSAVKNVKSGVLKNLSLSLKSSRTKSGAAAESESTENIVQPQQKESVRNMNRTPENKIEEAPENVEKDLKEFSANISGKAFAKQMHDVANSVKENEIKTVNAGNEKQENTPVQNQEKASGQQETDSAGKENSHNLNEQNASAHKSDSSMKNPETHFNAEINKAASPDAPAKQAVESSQNPLPSKLVKSADVIKEISKFIEKNEGHSLTIKIDPESLGSVKIALDVVDKLVRANIEVENEAAKKMVESNLNQLYSSLSQSGIQLNSLNISLANQEGKQHKNFSGRKKSINSDAETDYEQSNVGDAKQMGYNTYEYT
ncbi:MAG: flagellar hook-length control protein FliK, partial [Syntrophothermus sp.]